jgi:hypothetical protein
MNDRRLTPGAVLCLLDVSILSALCQQFVGGRICGSWFTDNGIEEKGIQLHVVLCRKVVERYASRHQWFRSGRESGGLPCGRAIDEAYVGFTSGRGAKVTLTGSVPCGSAATVS